MDNLSMLHNTKKNHVAKWDKNCLQPPEELKQREI